MRDSKPESRSRPGENFPAVFFNAIMKIGILLQNYTRLFQKAGFESAELEAAYILSEVTGIRHTLLLLHRERLLKPEELEKAEAFLRRRLKHEPFQYIFGKAWFRSLELDIGPGVLIPRPETELLAEFLLRRLKPASTVCELGAGSGALSLSLALERPDLRIWGSEKYPEALSWAERNRNKFKTENVFFSAGDLFSPFSGMKFDAIAANLPYIPESALPALPENVRDYEPHSALFAEDEGFAIVERAISESPDYLKYNGALFFEIGEDQGKRAREAAEKTGVFKHISIEKDLSGTDRFLIAAKE